MKRKIFIKSFLISLISVLFVFLACIGITYVNNKNIISERLITETQLAAALLDSTEDFSTLDIFKDQEECRITIMSTEGHVLYDSDAGGQLENHLDREEVMAALNGEEKTVERFSETFGCNMTYYATVTSLTDGQEVILRVAIWSAEINDYIFITLPFLIIALLISALVAGLFAKGLSSSITKRITGISASLKSVNSGDYLPLQAENADREFQDILSEINELNSHTVAHIRSEENEREKLNAVLDNISQGIIALTVTHKIAFVNGSALRMFNGTATVVSLDLSELLHDEGLSDRIIGATDRESARFEYKIGHQILMVEVILPEGKLLKDEIGHIVILSDITSEKALARQKEEFFANASHELKTPLTAMLGLSELALHKNTDGTVHKHLERIHKESLRLSDLISDMLKLSKLETLQEDITKAPVTLGDMTAEVLAELSEAIRAKGITTAIVGQATVMADEKRIYELLQNLCSNAVSYNKDGGDLTVVLEENETHTIIRVKDTGIGISEENIPHLCERFYRVDKSRSKKTGGTGLGLAIVKHICALYGADISIRSEVGVGTEVSVCFKK